MENIYRQTILVLILASGQLLCNANPFTNEYDTIPNWQIYYSDKLVLKGNATGQIEKLIDTVFYQPGKKYLTINYNYDSVDPNGKEIEIWDGENLLILSTFTEKPFKIDLWDILSRKTKDRIINLKVYYKDAGLTSKQLIGQLTFLFSTRPTFHHKID
jgi:hypothetical protein